MTRNLKAFLLLVPVLVIYMLVYMWESRVVLTLPRTFFLGNATWNGKGSLLSFDWLPGGFLNWNATETSTSTVNTPESHLVPLRGIGDSFLPFEEVYENSTEEAADGNPPLKKILFWNDVSMFYSLTRKQFFGNKSQGFGFGRDPFVKSNCRISTCFTTANRTMFSPEEVDAVVWHVRSRDQSFPPKRSPHTRYIYWVLESPMYVSANLKNLANVFNWTFTYRLDSDVPCPYNRVYRLRTPRPVPAGKNYASGKTKLAAWFVSNCATRSGRETLVNTLKKWMKVDVYGLCGQYKCPRGGNCHNMLERDYKFYFSFENSICKDYATEKIYNVLRYNVVPVVYGLANYTAFLPPKSHINALDFPSAESLAKYLLYLDKDDTAYNEYFRWKPYHSLATRTAQPWCDMCAKLHEDQSPKVYNDIYKWYITDAKCLTVQSPEISNFVSGVPIGDGVDPNRIVRP
ncbi:alpha-(1,3)-fucosyltransferase C-like [Macrobrachium rosenbergii]|uniref:alpha-(1,3)-fucosyltransferase C-like n=1 Tax=Macrobrachium rosenbergii TaxID=79674 RepID=UPI0034D72E43